MSLKPTKAQEQYLIEAEYDYLYHAKKLPPCPICGKALTIVQLGNGARTIRCVDLACLSYTIRGL